MRTTRSPPASSPIEILHHQPPSVVKFTDTPASSLPAPPPAPTPEPHQPRIDPLHHQPLNTPQTKEVRTQRIACRHGQARALVTPMTTAHQGMSSAVTIHPHRVALSPPASILPVHGPPPSQDFHQPLRARLTPTSLIGSRHLAHQPHHYVGYITHQPPSLRPQPPASRKRTPPASRNTNHPHQPHSYPSPFPPASPNTAVIPRSAALYFTSSRNCAQPHGWPSRSAGMPSTLMTPQRQATARVTSRRDQA